MTNLGIWALVRGKVFFWTRLGLIPLEGTKTYNLRPFRGLLDQKYGHQSWFSAKNFDFMTFFWHFNLLQKCPYGDMSLTTFKIKTSVDFFPWSTTCHYLSNEILELEIYKHLPPQKAKSKSLFFLCVPFLRV